jgi:hypothetical protein
MQSWAGPTLAPQDARGLELDPVGAKGAESGVKDRQIRRPFHRIVKSEGKRARNRFRLSAIPPGPARCF